MLKIVHKIIIREYLKNADEDHVFFKKSGSLIDSLIKKNDHANYNVKKVYKNKLHN